MSLGLLIVLFIDLFEDIIVDLFLCMKDGIYMDVFFTIFDELLASHGCHCINENVNELVGGQMPWLHGGQVQLQS
jgi:hypothetical protein